MIATARPSLALVLLGLLVLACTRGPAEEELVRAAYRDYREALLNGDPERLRGLVSAARRPELERPGASALLELARQLTPTEVELTAVTVSGAEATVEATAPTEAGRATGRVRLVKEPEGWRVDKEEWSVRLTLTGPAASPLLPDPATPPRPHAVLEGHEQGVSRLAFTPDGGYLLSGSYGDQTLRTWDAGSGQAVAASRSARRIMDLAVAPDRRTVYTTDVNAAVTAWPLQAGRIGEPRRLLPDAGHSLALSADGRWLATAGSQKPVRLWSLPDGQPGAELGGAAAQRALAFVGLATLVTAGDGNTYSVFSKSPGRLWGESWREDRRTIGGVAASGQILSLDVTRDGTALVTGHNDSSIVVVDLKSRGERFNFFVRDAGTHAVRWSPDGALLATAHQDAAVYLWDARTARRVAVLRGHGGPVTSLAFSPDGGTLASGGEDGRIVLWRSGPPPGG